MTELELTIEKAAQNMGLTLSPCQCEKLERNEELWWRVRLENSKYLVVRARIYDEEEELDARA